jgi:2-hydroxyacyl-CoA lyase 1
MKINLRYNLPVIFVIFNNNGIYGGIDKKTFNQIAENGDPTLTLPPMSLTANIRYEKFASAFEKFKGYFAQTPDDIQSALRSALKETRRPSIINIEINTSADRKAQVIEF